MSFILWNLTYVEEVLTNKSICDILDSFSPGNHFVNLKLIFGAHDEIHKV